MADRMPNYHVEQQRLRALVADLKLRIERYKQEVMETESRRRNALLNYKAAVKAVAEHEANLDALEKEHGVEVLDMDALLAEVDEEEDEDG